MEQNLGSMVMHGGEEEGIDCDENLESMVMHGGEEEEEGIDYDENDMKEYLNSLPPGYRFCPYDDELILHYLKPKLNNRPLPINRIHNVDIYQYHPQFLFDTYREPRDCTMYFFTPRNKKYLNGKRPNRAIGRIGYWKATGGEVEIKVKKQRIGSKRTLVYFNGAPGNHARQNKTDWIMYEYMSDKDSIANSIETSSQDAMKLDDFVLCKVYNKRWKDVEKMEEELNKTNPTVESVVAQQQQEVNTKEEPVSPNFGAQNHQQPTQLNTSGHEFTHPPPPPTKYICSFKATYINHKNRFDAINSNVYDQVLPCYALTNANATSLVQCNQNMDQCYSMQKQIDQTNLVAEQQQGEVNIEVEKEPVSANFAPPNQQQQAQFNAPGHDLIYPSGTNYTHTFRAIYSEQGSGYNTVNSNVYGQVLPSYTPIDADANALVASQIMGISGNQNFSIEDGFVQPGYDLSFGSSQSIQQPPPCCPKGTFRCNL